tara:strand:- start:1302 stop:2402 length:1101 start_codon:yes stop_codon:yes gene_type:complete
MDKSILLIDKLNIIREATNRIETDINNMNLRLGNINTENAQTNDILKFDGANWIPAALPPGAASGVSRAQTSASESLASENAAVTAASESLEAEEVAAEAEANAERAKLDIEEKVAESLESRNTAEQYAANAALLRSDSQNLIASKARINNPVFTGTVNLPSGTTINNVPILLYNNDKIISRVYRSGVDDTPDYATGGNSYDYSVVRFHEVSLNTFGTPTLNSGSHTIQSSTTLWANDGQRTYFTVPPGRSGIYRILGNITGQFGQGDYQGGVGLRMNCIIYRVRSSVHKSICYSEFRARHITDNLGSMLDELTMNIDQMFELNSGDEIYIKLRAGHPYWDNSANAFRLKAGNFPGSCTNLTIMEM